MNTAEAPATDLGPFDDRVALVSLTEAVLRIRDGHGPVDRTVREQLDDALDDATRAGVGPVEHGHAALFCFLLGQMGCDGCTRPGCKRRR